jgi:phosphatidylethanolamine-binding protein (PEBP) family uncharacterized protein
VPARVLTTLAVAGLFVLSACGPDDGRHLADPDPELTAVPVPTTSPAAIVDTNPALTTTGPGGLTIEGLEFGPGENLPVESACGGPTSPGLRWTDAPRRVTELALVVQDIDGNGSIQWLVTDLPPEATEIPTGTAPTGGEIRLNTTGTATWTSPCPRDGFAHRIVFTLYALDQPLPEGAADAASIVDAIRASAIGSASVLGRAGIPEG